MPVFVWKKLAKLALECEQIPKAQSIQAQEKEEIIALRQKCAELWAFGTAQKRILQQGASKNLVTPIRMHSNSK